MYIIAMAVSLLLSSFEMRISQLNQIESKPESHTILFVRHGESALNVPDANGVLYTSGKSVSVPLTEKGRKQADDLGGKLIGKLSAGTDYVILSSTALRAQETADRIFEQLKSHYSMERGESYENLCEVAKGTWEGHPRDEKYHAQLKLWDLLSAKEKYYTPKLNTGESYYEVVTKALQDLQKIVNNYPHQTIIIVSHFETMNALTLYWSGQINQLSEEPSTPLPALQFSNGDMLKVEINQKDPIERAQVQAHIKSEL